MSWIAWIACIVGAYLVGSIPFGVLLARTRGVNIREHGSRNIGATNVARVLGRELGALCFLLDVGKGVAPVLVTGFICDVVNRGPLSEPPITQIEAWLWLGVAVASVLGHMFSIYLGFAGGKGVATSFGALAAMWPLLTLPALGALVAWYAILRLFKYVSLASMAASISLPLWYLLAWLPPIERSDDPADYLLRVYPPLVITAFLALVVVHKHRGNIARLRRGEEPKIGGAARRGEVLADKQVTDDART